MGALRDRMSASLRLRNLSPRTIKAYLWHVTDFTRYFDQAPDLPGEEEVRQYLQYLLDERKVSWSNMNIGYSALKCRPTIPVAIVFARSATSWPA